MKGEKALLQNKKERRGICGNPKDVIFVVTALRLVYTLGMTVNEHRKR
jgi:hypothetical protein